MGDIDPNLVAVDKTAPLTWNVTLGSSKKIARVALWANGTLKGFVDLALTVEEYEELDNLGATGNVSMAPNANHPVSPG